jgi:hypothetical protein
MRVIYMRKWKEGLCVHLEMRWKIADPFFGLRSG